MNAGWGGNSSPRTGLGGLFNDLVGPQPQTFIKKAGFRHESEGKTKKHGNKAPGSPQLSQKSVEAAIDTQKELAKI